MIAIQHKIWFLIYPPTQKTTALPVDECVNRALMLWVEIRCFGGFRHRWKIFLNFELIILNS